MEKATKRYIKNSYLGITTGEKTVIRYNYRAFNAGLFNEIALIRKMQFSPRDVEFYKTFARANLKRIRVNRKIATGNLIPF